jgi:hypothetical protein
LSSFLTNRPPVLSSVRDLPWESVSKCLRLLKSPRGP